MNDLDAFQVKDIQCPDPVYEDYTIRVRIIERNNAWPPVEIILPGKWAGSKTRAAKALKFAKKFYKALGELGAKAPKHYVFLGYQDVLGQHHGVN